MKTKHATFYNNNAVLQLLTAFPVILDLQMHASVSKYKKIYILCFIRYHGSFADISFAIICSLKLSTVYKDFTDQ